MRWVAVFEDDPTKLAVREAFTAAHMAYLHECHGAIVDAGGLRAAPGEAPCGGLWVVNAETPDEVMRLCEQDPFFRHGLRKSVRIFAWSEAFAPSPPG